MTEIRLSPLQVRALLLLAERDPVVVMSGQDVHGAVASALVGHGLAERVPAGGRALFITDGGRQVAARLAAEQATAAERASRQVGRVMGP